MRNLLTSTLLVSALALTPAAALAQSSVSDTLDKAGEALSEQTASETATEKAAEKAEVETAADRGVFLSAQTTDQTLSSNYIGATVLIGSGEEQESVGTVSQLILDENDVITGAVVDVGGFLGLGAKPVGLQWDAMKRVKQEESVAFTTSLSREELENAPEFQTQEEIASEESIEMEGEGSASTTTD